MLHMKKLLLISVITGGFGYVGLSRSAAEAEGPKILSMQEWLGEQHPSYRWTSWDEKKRDYREHVRDRTRPAADIMSKQEWLDGEGSAHRCWSKAWQQWHYDEYVKDCKKPADDVLSKREWLKTAEGVQCRERLHGAEKWRYNHAVEWHYDRYVKRNRIPGIILSMKDWLGFEGRQYDKREWVCQKKKYDEYVEDSQSPAPGIKSLYEWLKDEGRFFAHTCRGTQKIEYDKYVEDNRVPAPGVMSMAEWLMAPCKVLKMSANGWIEVGGKNYQFYRQLYGNGSRSIQQRDHRVYVEKATQNKSD